MMGFLLIFIVCFLSVAWWEALDNAANKELEGCDEAIRGGVVKLTFFAYALIVAFSVTILI